MKLICVLAFYFSWALACSSGGSDSSQYDVAGGKATVPSMDQGEAMSGGGQATQSQSVEVKIIRDGRMSVDVRDIHKAKTFVDGIIAKYSARTSGEQFENTDYQATYYIRIRVPAARLDSLVSDLETIDGSVTSKSIDARDVTEEFIDLETRLENKRSYLAQYRELLKSAKTTEDVLKITEQIRQIEEELESVEGRLRYLNDQVDMSTLELSLIQHKDYVYKPDRSINFPERLKESLSGGWYGFVQFTLFVIRLWPFLILIIGFWLIFKKVRKLRRSARTPSKPA